MATDKNSFVLYTDKRELIKKLVEDDRKNKTNNAGELFLHIFDYVKDLNPDPINFTVDIAFEPIKQNLKKDLVKWRDKQEQRVQAGRLGGITRAENAKQNLANQATAKTLNQSQANQAVNGNVTGTDTVSGTDIVNKKKNIGKAHRFSPPSQKDIYDLMVEKKLKPQVAKIESEKFWNFYDSKNWYVGKNKMQKWESSVAGWLSRAGNFTGSIKTEQPKKSFSINR